MSHSKDLLYRLHRLSFANRPLVEKSTVCGCFHCGAIYSPDVIDPETDYCIDMPHDTATCPYCWIDSVICDAMGVEVTPELLEEMRYVFFEQDVDETEDEGRFVLPAAEGEEPDECLERVVFPEGGEVLCRVLLEDAGEIALARTALTELPGLERAADASVTFALPFGTGVVMRLTLPEGGEKTVRWDYRKGQLTAYEKEEMQG